MSSIYSRIIYFLNKAFRLKYLPFSKATRFVIAVNSKRCLVILWSENVSVSATVPVLLYVNLAFWVGTRSSDRKVVGVAAWACFRALVAAPAAVTPAGGDRLLLYACVFRY